MPLTDDSISAPGPSFYPGSEPTSGLGSSRSSSAAAATSASGGASATGDRAALEQVRGLLLAEDRARLDALQRRLDDPERRISELADVLSDAVRLRAEDDRFISALQRPVDQCIQHSVERNPQGLADALFPVMGPAIRRAIGEALKGIVQSINQAVEHSISAKGLRWRIEAWRSGTSFAEVVLKNTLLYRVDAAYLIHNDNGLLIEHALAETQTTLKDEDAMSAMLTAIQDFIQDSFTGSNEGLESVEIGGRSLWVLRGPKATLACVITGMPPRSLREQLDGTLRDLHLSYRKQLDAFDGDKSPFAGVEPLLQDCLTLAYRESAQERVSKVRWLPWALAGVMLLSGLGWLGWTQYVWGQRLDAARNRLEEAPGLVLVNWRPSGERWAHLLVDPMAEAPEAVIADEEIAAWLDLQTRPYISADAPIVLERVKQQLAPPETLTLSLSDAVLHVEGQASDAWVEAVRALRVLPPGVDRIDLTAMTSGGTSLLDRARAAIEPPAGVNVAVDDSKLLLSGVAPWDWINALPQRLVVVEGLLGCDHQALDVAELRRAEAIAMDLNATLLEFGDNHKLLPSADGPLDQVATQITELVALKQVVPFGLEIDVIGYSDQAGTERWRTWLRQRRAEQVIRQLGERGVPADVLRPVPRPGFEPTEESATVAEEAHLRVQLQPVALPPCWIG